MSRQTIGSSLNPGTMVPKKHDLVKVVYDDGPPSITHYGYFANTSSGTPSFLGRVEIEFDTQGRDIRVELFADDGGIF